MKKALWGLLALIAIVAIGLMLWEPLLATRSAAPAPRTYDVEIARDEFGVPHIFGKTDADAAYGLAYAHAEDDFATLQEVIAMTRGRLGAMTGGDGAKTDYVAQLLAVHKTVDRDYARQPADVRALLDGYAAGLNRFADTHPEELRLRGLFPVNGRDVAAGFALRSPFFFGLDNVIEALAGNKPLPPQSAGPLPDAPNVTPAGPAAIEKGSNAFVVGPSRSEDGATRLVSNSHQPWRGSVAWYEVVVHSQQGWDFAGALFPGAPMPLMGHNKTLGWTNTVNRPDLIDVYKLVLDKSGEKYRYDGKWRPLETERIWLRAKFGPFVLPVPQTIRRSIHGPVMINDQGAFAIRYAGSDQLRMVEQYYRITKARDFGEWQAAMALQGVPATNFLYADARGNIALFYNASFPERAPGFDYAGVLPGDTSRAVWQRTVDWARVPRLINPASGYLMNANNTPFIAAGPTSELDPKAYSPLLGIESDTTNRGQRSIELMEADAKISGPELEAIKFDTGVSKASWAGAWFALIDRLDVQAAPELARAQALLRQWDWNFDGRGKADALAVLLMRAGNRTHYRRLPTGDARVELDKAAVYLMKHFGRIDPPLGNMLRLRQGKIDLPLDGGPDVLRAMPLWDEDKDGRLAARHGDSFTMFIEWDKAGRVRSKSIQPFGAATTRPNSRHYTDQAALFTQHGFKPVRFDPADLKAHAMRIYRP